MDKARQIPWSQRTKGDTTGAYAQGQSGMAARACRQFLQTPFATIMLGAALMSGQPFLIWNTERLLNEIIKDSQTRSQASGWTMLAALMRIIRSPDPAKEQYGYAMLFHTLVVPFALMDQSVNKHRK